MNEKHFYLALLKIKNNTSITELIYEGLNYEQISALITDLIHYEMVVETATEVILSEKGMSELLRLERTYKKREKQKWIMPAEKFRIAKIDKSFIFVPDQGEINF